MTAEQMPVLHIHRARGHYIGQLRYPGHQKYRTVTGRCRTLAGGTLSAGYQFTWSNHHRLRVLFVDDSGYYDPTVAFEGTRK